MEDIRKWKIPQECYEPQSSEKWDACPTPLRDEVFSSWFTRTAKANYSTVFGILKALGNRNEYPLAKLVRKTRVDPDTDFKHSWMKKIAKFIDLEPAVLSRMALFSKIEEPHGRQHWQAVLRPLCGARYCPICLAEDSIPYFRYTWRLTFITVCFEHDCFLQDTCLHCDASIRYWVTHWDQPLTSCFKCKGNLISENHPVEKTPNLREKAKFQETLLNTFSSDKWHGKPIEWQQFYPQLWKMAWIEIADRKTWEPSLFPWVRDTLQSAKKTFLALSLAVDIVREDPKRLEKPFHCLDDDRRFSKFSGLMRHLSSHQKEVCPVCGDHAIEPRLETQDLRCRRCGVIFTKKREIVYPSIKPPNLCPLCGYGRMMTSGSNFRCQRCGTISTANAVIISRGLIPPDKCPLCQCAQLRRKGENFRCQGCGAICSEKNEVISQSALRPAHCPFCLSSRLSRKEDNFRCKRCGTVLTATKEIVEEGKKPPANCPLCKNKYLERSGGEFRCQRCGTICTAARIISERGIFPPKKCPLCDYKRLTRTKGNFRCLICGTICSSAGEIKEQGIIPPEECPLCERKSLTRSGDEFRCGKCGTTCNASGEIAEKGTVPPK
ncbi:MAG: TniQ family protein [Candidatus Heimdallarchaeota archaeon]